MGKRPIRLIELKRGVGMNLADAEKNFGVLVNRVYAEGISVDLERDDKVIARLTPADPSSPLTVGGLLAFLRNLPPLGEDARAIARQNPCLFGLNFSSCVASSGFFHLPKRKTPENKPFNVRLPCEDADAFAHAVRTIRAEFPAEVHS